MSGEQRAYRVTFAGALAEPDDVDGAVERAQQVVDAQGLEHLRQFGHVMGDAGAGCTMATRDAVLAAAIAEYRRRQVTIGGPRVSTADVVAAINARAPWLGVTVGPDLDHQANLSKVADAWSGKTDPIVRG